MSQLFEFEIKTNDEDFINETLVKNNSSLISSKKAIVNIDIDSNDISTKYICIETPNIETANNLIQDLNEKYQSKAIRFNDKSWDIALGEEIEKYKEFENDKIIVFHCPSPAIKDLTLQYNGINQSIEEANKEYLTIISRDISTDTTSVVTPIIKSDNPDQRQPLNNININAIINEFNLDTDFTSSIKQLETNGFNHILDIDNIKFSNLDNINNPNAIAILNIQKDINIEELKAFICKEIEQSLEQDIKKEIDR